MDVILNNIYMKIFFLIILVFTLFSCNNNENNVKNSKNVISCDELSKEDQTIYQCEK